MNWRVAIEILLAVAAALGSVVSWLAASSAEMAAPVAAHEPSMPTTAYDPSMIALAVLLATVAGVFTVLGVARLRRG